MSGTQRATTPFGAHTTAAEVVSGVDLSGRRAIVTGGASGIGVATARALASANAEVTLAARDVEAGRRAAEDIMGSTGNKPVLVTPLDLAEPASVTAFVRGWSGPLHILVNNAGIMATPLMRNRCGWEMQFAVNHLGHFALATGLRGALASAGGARVVSVSSVGHINGDVVFDDIHFQHRAYDPWQAYSQSKTANILFAVAAAARWSTDRIAVNALNPGRIPDTNLARHVGDLASALASSEPDSTGVSWKNAEQGAATSVLLAASPLVEGVSGGYFEDCNEAGPHQPGIRRGVADYALDPDAAARLWRVSIETLADRSAPRGSAESSA